MYKNLQRVPMLKYTMQNFTITNRVTACYVTYKHSKGQNVRRILRNTTQDIFHGFEITNFIRDLFNLCNFFSYLKKYI